MTYELGKCLGSGTYGKVYSASSLLTRRKMALKRLLIYASTKANYIVSLREIDMLARFKHPNIMPLSDVVFDKTDFSPVEDPKLKDDAICIVMPEAKTTLDKFARATSSLAARKRMIYQLLAGINHIHLNGFIHRDLKPQNILIFDGGLLKIGDLGLAVPYIQCEPRTPDMVTIWYRSPEIFHGKDYDFKADIWSIGCICFELIANRPLFNGRTDKAMLEQFDYFYGRKISPDKTRPYVSGMNFRGVDEFVHKNLALSKDSIAEFDSSPGTYRHFVNLIAKTLRVEPLDRPSATDLIAHQFFDGYREELSLNVLPPQKSHYLYLHPLRTAGIKIINRQKKCEFRIRFLALDILDRILEIHSDVDEDQVRKYALCSYYIAEKFLIGESARAFNQLVVSSSSDYENYQDTEKKVLRDLLKFMIYRKTLYDYLPPQVSREEIERAYYLYTHITNLSGIRLDHFYAIYRYVSSNWKSRDNWSETLNIPQETVTT